MKIRLAVQCENKISVYGSCENIPNSVFKYFLLEGPEPLYYVYLPVCHTCGQRGPRSGRASKTKFGPTYFVLVHLQYRTAMGEGVCEK